MDFFDAKQIGVKICGITSLSDAHMCIAAGAGALGFNFFPGSKRYLPPEPALPWIKSLSTPAARVAVVVNPDESLIRLLRNSEAFDAIQFHGDESPAFCAAAGFARWIRAVRVSDLTSLQHALAYDTPHLLLDAAVAGSYGGTGQRLDWNLARDFVCTNNQRRFILAGGLNAENVTQAVRIVRPSAVDVAGGVEASPGIKDEYLARHFVAATQNGAVTNAKTQSGF